MLKIQKILSWLQEGKTVSLSLSWDDTQLRDWFMASFHLTVWPAMALSSLWDIHGRKLNICSWQEHETSGEKRKTVISVLIYLYEYTPMCFSSICVQVAPYCQWDGYRIICPSVSTVLFHSQNQHVHKST